MHKNYLRLTQSISSTIYEGIVKIGYEKDTSMSIYYDLGLLNYLLDTDFDPPEDCMPTLLSYMKEMNQDNKLLQITMVNGRFQFTVTSQGIEKILSDYQTKPFLKELVDLARNHCFTLQDVQDLFARQNKEYHYEETDNEEFQYVFSFLDPSFDEYIYCFNFTDCYYHRLLPYDYDRL